jgi:cell wall-associated NlpC family hydrolase
MIDLGGRKRRQGWRLATAGVLAVLVSLTAGVTTSSARVSHQDLVAAEDQLASLNGRLSLLVEEYDQAALALAKTRMQLADAQRAASQAQAAAEAARAAFAGRARAAYEGAGSQLDILLGATSFQQFSDRLQFLNSVAKQDTDAAAQASVAREAAARAAAALSIAVRNHQADLQTLSARKADIQSSIAQQQSLIAQLRSQLAKQALDAALARQAAQAAREAPSPVGTPGPDPGPPPPPSGGAAAAVAAAYSAIGTPYAWGGSSPETGFDCSGLTMWSWAHGGVSLSHSSAAQYAELPHLSRDQLQPGDLLFFYSPIHHVALYVGGGQVIEALHPGTTVLKDTPDWANYVGAARPG